MVALAFVPHVTPQPVYASEIFESRGDTLTLDTREWKSTGPVTLSVPAGAKVADSSDGAEPAGGTNPHTISDEVTFDGEHLPFAVQTKPSRPVSVQVKATPGTYCLSIHAHSLGKKEPRQHTHTIRVESTDGTTTIDTDPADCPTDLDEKYRIKPPELGPKQHTVKAENTSAGYVAHADFDARGLDGRVRMAFRHDGHGTMGVINPNRSQGGYIATRGDTFAYDISAPTIEPLHLTFSEPGTHCVAYSMYGEDAKKPARNGMLTVTAQGAEVTDDRDADGRAEDGEASDGAADSQCAPTTPVPRNPAESPSDSHDTSTDDKGADNAEETGPGQEGDTSGNMPGQYGATPGVTVPTPAALPFQPVAANVCAPAGEGQMVDVTHGQVLISPTQVQVNGAERAPSTVNVTVPDSARTAFTPSTTQDKEFATPGSQVWATGGANAPAVGWSANDLDPALVKSMQVTLTRVSGPGNVIIQQKDALGKNTKNLRQGSQSTVTPGQFSTPTFMFNQPGAYDVEFETLTREVHGHERRVTVVLRFNVGKKLPAQVVGSPLGALIGHCQAASLTGDIVHANPPADPPQAAPVTPEVEGPSNWWWGVVGAAVLCSIALAILAASVWVRGDS
ncbi:hypothetical protein HMPREF0183_1842 [Brevibacterium mcbrellneri ATCC 49030]|uniref:Uncharacterized protein n=1 Tax=Brevibacterium mcbrellneri ATCC 49030 TaxID=585530 RepID=D4YPI2_9MICO|nr:hypothetical protein HMPREF0183_1842 [Brevibacterium mcbrellneri ATCC 49030]